MSWFAKISQFESDERIIAAAIFANGKLYTGPSHMHALLKAMEDRALFRDPETDELISPNGIKHIDLFLTNKNKVIDRFEADRYFGISASEDMSEQKLQTGA